MADEERAPRLKLGVLRVYIGKVKLAIPLVLLKMHRIRSPTTKKGTTKVNVCEKEINQQVR